MRKALLPVLLCLFPPLLAPGARADVPPQVVPGGSASRPDVSRLETGQAQMSFAAFVAGFNIMNLRAGIDLRADGYRIAIAYRTAGTFGAMMRGRFSSHAEGRFQGARVIPRHFENFGTWRGEDRHIVIDYPDGQPKVITLVPPQDVEREPVPEALQRDSVDGFTLIVSLVRNFARTGGCDGELHLYDGRRALRVTARTVGLEMLPSESRSIFRGEAMRCDFESVIVGGFMKDSEPGDASRRPQKGSVWLARVVPDMPAVPVLMSLETRLAGHVNIYVTEAAKGLPKALMDEVP